MVFYRRKNRSESICVPETQYAISEHEDKSGYPTVKYIAISKSYESKKVINVRGRKRTTKTYGIGVLTTDNEYFYSELVLKNSELTERLTPKLKLLFLNRYNYTDKTVISISKNMATGRNDPISIFIQIISSCLGLTVKRTTLLQKVKYLNCLYHYLTPTEYGITSKRIKKFLRKLVKHNRFEFITEENWFKNLENDEKSKREAKIECALGILHCQAVEHKAMYLSKYKEKKKKETLEEYIINGKTNSSEETENETK